MRKKDLINLNVELFSKADGFQKEIENLKKENEVLKKENISLLNEIQNLKSKLESSESLKKLEEKILAQVNISQDKQYGAEIIGKIVVISASHCTELSSKEQTKETKELINLILGRTEIAKAEILRIVSENLPFETKKSLIDSEKENAKDYFLSVLAQKY